jgi:hypothetical protein
MQEKEILKQMIDFNKASFENAFTAVTMMQDQLERMMGVLLEQATWLPQEAKKAASDWVEVSKKAREDYKKTMDEGFGMMETYISDKDKAKTD